MAAAASWDRPWDNSANQSIQPPAAPLSHSMTPSAHNPYDVARSRQDRKTLPPISNAVYGTLRAPLSPESATQQSPSRAASALPPASGTPATLDGPQRVQLGHRDSHDSSFLRRLSLLPLVYDHGSGECKNISLYTDRMRSQPPWEQHQPNGSYTQSKRHMSVADLPQVAALVRGASDWAVGQPPKAVRDEDAPTAVETPQYSHGMHSERLHAVVQAIVSELTLLHNALDGAGSPPVWSAKAVDVAELGLQHCLDWAYQSIRRVSRWCRCQSIRMTADAGDETPRLLDAVPIPPSLAAKKRKVDGLEGEEAETRKRSCQDTCNDRFEALDRCRDHTMTNIWKKSYMRDHPPPPLSKSLRPADSSASLASMSPPSSMYSSSSARALPTPSSLSFSCFDVLPTLSPSADPSHSAQATHLQDLQHQISTKTLALQTLQREHDNLLSAFSRSQIRCATLEKKFQVSDTEINTLTDDRIKLMSQVEVFEAQVEELTSSREEARRQSVANGGQYMKIMAMASRLEAQGAADKKRWMSEREAWDREKSEYCREIQTLQEEREKVTPAGKAPVSDLGLNRGSPHESLQLSGPDLHTSSPTHSDLLDGAPSMESDDVLTSTSLLTLRNEIVRLRKSFSAMQIALRDVRTEGERMEQAMCLLGSIKQQIFTKVDAGIRACGSCAQPVQEDTALEVDRPAELSRSPTHGVVSHAGST